MFRIDVTLIIRHGIEMYILGTKKLLLVELIYWRLDLGTTPARVYDISFRRNVHSYFSVLVGAR